jgi:hypothetical protein
MLVGAFYTFYASCLGKRPSAAAEAARLRELRDAAKLLASADGLFCTPLWLIGDPECEQFFATATRLASFWDAEVERLSSRVGRPRHAAFHDLIAELILVYERLTRRRAKKPWAQRSKPGYGGDFYEFAVAVWRCLKKRIPEVRHIIPASESAVAEALRSYWPRPTKSRGEN